MDEIINSHFDSEKFLIIQKELVKGRSLSIKIYNPLSPNKDEDQDQPYELCLYLFIDNLEKDIVIEYLTNCGVKNGGTIFVQKVIDFGRINGYKKIILEDDSVMPIYGKDKDGNIKETIDISLGKFKYLKEGISWYGKLGFSNKIYEEHKDSMLEFINNKLTNIIASTIESNIYSVMRIIDMDYLVGIDTGISSKYPIRHFFNIEKSSIISSIRKKIYFVDITEDMTLSELFKSFEKFLKSNNQFLEDDIETRENIKHIQLLTEYFFNIMSNKLSLPNLLFGSHLEYTL